MERSCDDSGVIADATSSEDATNADSEFVETDPTGRYGRYEEVLGKGAYKTVYKAFDDLDGIEVAWNQVKLQDMVHSGGDMDRLYSELHLLKTLKHKNIIKFYNSWVDTRNKSVNFITEIFTSGTLRQYRKKHKHVKLRAIKHWARQILQGLVYLHSHEPPIIHRDLKCDNIFINGNNGEVKIGDLGLATILRQAPAAHSVIGTPEFMAPELYEEHYNELVDIYSFGMCLLEMLTSEYPYSECANAAQIYKKVTTGKKPAALNKVRDPETRNFVEKCLASAPQRRHAKELLLDPFLRNDDDSENLDLYHPVMVNHNDTKGLEPVPEETNCRLPQEIEPFSDVDNEFSLLHSKCNEIISDSPRSREAFKRSRDFKIKGRKQDEKNVLVRIRITSSRGGVRYIQFDFDVEADTAMSVASEMVTELELSDQDVTTIADMIDAEIMSLIPDWKPGLSFDEPVDEEFVDEHQESVSEDSPEQHDLPEDISVQDNHCRTLDSSNDLQDVLGPRNDIFNTYGRFEELGCTRSGSNQRQPETEGSEIFSDFSSEQLEGGGSESSLDGSLERSSIDISVDNSLNSQIDAVHSHSKQESVDEKPYPGLDNGYVNKEFIPSHVTDGEADDDAGCEDLSILLLQQDQKLEDLISKHVDPSSEDFGVDSSDTQLDDTVSNDLRMDKSLLQIRTLNNSLGNQLEQTHITSNHSVNGLGNGCISKASISSSATEGEVDDDAGSEDLRTLILQQKHELQLLRSKHKQALLNLKMNLNRDATVPGETQPTEGFGLPVQTSFYQDRNCQRTENKVSPRTKDDDCPAEIPRQNHDNIIMSTLASYQNGESELGLLRNQNRNNKICCLDASKSNTSEKSQACCSNNSATFQGECGSLRSTEADSKHDDSSKPEKDSLAKRECYLELYKCRSNLKDKPLKAADAYTNGSTDGPSTKDTDQEQLRKQQLQKSIADLEAKTLEGLLQTKSKYVAGAAVKSHVSAAQNVQTSSSTAPGRPQQVTTEITKA